MPFETLRSYMDMCRREGIKPTWQGLIKYAGKMKGGPAA